MLEPPEWNPVGPGQNHEKPQKFSTVFNQTWRSLIYNLTQVLREGAQPACTSVGNVRPACPVSRPLRVSRKNMTGSFHKPFPRPPTTGQPTCSRCREMSGGSRAGWRREGLEYPAPLTRPSPTWPRLACSRCSKKRGLGEHRGSWSQLRAQLLSWLGFCRTLKGREGAKTGAWNRSAQRTHLTLLLCV